MTSARRESLSNLSNDEIDRILSRDVSATIAFLDKQGFPRMVPCWFLWDGTAFYVTSEPEKFHVRCLVEDNRASLCVEVEEVVPGQRRSNRQIKAVGRIEIFEDLQEGGWRQRIRKKYLGPAALPDVITPTTSSRVVLKLLPMRLSAHGGGTVVDSSPD